MDSFFTKEEIKQLGLESFGENVFISRNASIYFPHMINIGSNVRIDDFCILSGKIRIGDFTHIAAYSALYGGISGIYIDKYANISAKNTIFAVSNNCLGLNLVNPVIPSIIKNEFSKKVIIEKHVIIGAGCIILPGVILSEGSAFGALTLIDRNSEAWTINAGIPFRKIKKRSNELLKLEKKFNKENDV